MNCAFYSNKECKALTKMCQNPDKCSFFITSEQLSASTCKSHKKLQKLPEKVQSHVARKYYSGKAVWKNTPTLSSEAE